QIVRMGNFTVSIKEEDEATLKRLTKDVAYSRLAGGFQSYAQGQAMLGAAEGMAKGGEGGGAAVQGIGLGVGFGMASALANPRSNGGGGGPAPPAGTPFPGRWTPRKGEVRAELGEPRGAAGGGRGAPLRKLRIRVDRRSQILPWLRQTGDGLSAT